MLFPHDLQKYKALALLHKGAGKSLLEPNSYHPISELNSYINSSKELSWPDSISTQMLLRMEKHSISLTLGRVRVL